jgi:hypothetical protein
MQDLEVLRQVQIQSDLQKTMSGTVLTFAQYTTILPNTATGYDKSTNKPASNGKSRRSVFNSETLFGHDDVICDDDMAEFDWDHVDTSPTELQAFAMNRRERPQFKSGSCMPIGRWKVLSEEAKKIWDQMEDDDKAKILALSETHKTAAPSGPSKFSINSHTTTDPPSDDLDDILLAMVTKHSNRSKPYAVILLISARFFPNLPRQPRLKSKTMKYRSMVTPLREESYVS